MPRISSASFLTSPFALLTRYTAGLLLLVLLPLAGCDASEENAFDVEVRVEDTSGEPIQGASVRVQPCFEINGTVRCGSQVFGVLSVRSEVSAKSVELASWTATAEDQDAVLSWTTASETENAGFRIEQKKGTASFQQVDFVKGAGTTSSANDYGYRVTDLLPGTYEFRLVAVETDGTEVIAGESKPVAISISEPAIQGPFANPFSDRTTMRVSAPEPSSVTVRAFGVDGTKTTTIFDSEIPANQTIPFDWRPGADVPSGVYEVRTQIEAGGEILDRDTSLVARIQDSQPPTLLGETSDDGRVGTTDRMLFPALYDVPPFGVRTATGVLVGEMQPAGAAEFVVVVDDTSQTYRREVTDGKNTFTLSVSP